MNRHKAPPASYPLGPCVLYGRLLLLVWCVGAVLVGGHAWSVGSASVWPLLLLALTGWCALRAWRMAPIGRLFWMGADGWAWHAEGDTAAVGLSVPVLVWRGDGHLLLRCPQGPRGLTWLWIERWRDPLCWDAICRAARAL